MITINPNEYRESMQRAALAFLLRHQAEHLADDGRLFARAVSYLVNGLDVPTFMADRLVHLAMGDLEGMRVAVEPGAGDDRSVVTLVRATGEVASVRYRLLPRHIQALAIPPAAAAAH